MKWQNQRFCPGVLRRRITAVGFLGWSGSVVKLPTDRSSTPFCAALFSKIGAFAPFLKKVWHKRVWEGWTVSFGQIVANQRFARRAKARRKIEETSVRKRVCTVLAWPVLVSARKKFSVENFFGKIEETSVPGITQ